MKFDIKSFVMGFIVGGIICGLVATSTSGESNALAQAKACANGLAYETQRAQAWALIAIAERMK